MKLLCHIYKTCIYKNTCDHAIPHEQKINVLANTCILKRHIGINIDGTDIECFCSNKPIRKQNLQKINERQIR